MASWTDSIPQFNPYVQQLPVDAMVQVGMQKQKQYDEGIQKIQTNIDNVAGLDIAKESDKVYLQSKLNQLGNDLKFVAAGDFSNFQLVNSVNGMTNQLVKDRNVQAAVSSTAWLRKQDAEMEKAISEGKSSQSNIYDFNDIKGKYLNSKKIGESFNGRYTQYTDVKKKAMDAIKALHPDLIKYDMPFKVDANGKMDVRFYADAMKRYKIEGISESKIAQAIYASMTPDDLNQLRIDGKYEFRGAGFDQLTEKAKGDYDVQRSQAVSALELLETQRAVTTDPTRIDELDEQIDSYKEQLGVDGKPGTLDEAYYNNIELARTDPDAVKYNIYKNGFVKEFANAFKWSSKEEEAVVNPYKQQENWVAGMKLDQAKFQQSKYEFGVNTQFKIKELEQKDEENRLKAQENALKNAEQFGVESPWTTLGNPTDNANRGQELFTNHVVSVDDSIKSDMKVLKDKGYTDKQINTMLNNWNDAQGVVSKANIPANALKTIMSITKNQNYVSQLQDFQTKTRTEAEKEAGVSSVINNALKGKTNVTFYSEGKKRTLSPRDIVGVQTKQVLLDYETPGRPTKKFSYVDPRGLTADQLAYARAVYGRNGIAKVDKNGNLVANKEDKGFTVTNETRFELDRVTRPHLQAASQIKTAMNKANEIYKQKIGESANVFVPKIKAVANGKGEVPPMVLQGLNQLIIAQQRKGIKTDGKFDFETASGYLTNKEVKDTRVLVEQDGDNYTIQLQNLKDPENTQTFKVTGADVQGYLGDKYVNPNVQESSRFAIGKGKSDILGSHVATKALMQKRFGDFPGIKKLQVTANLEEDTPGLFIPTVYLKQKDGKYVRFEISGDDKLSRVGYEQGVDNLNRLNDEVLLKTLKQAYPKYDFSKIDY
jgi:hypothetical protein